MSRLLISRVFVEGSKFTGPPFGNRIAIFFLSKYMARNAYDSFGAWNLPQFLVAEAPETEYY